MDNNYLLRPLIFIIDTAFYLYILLIMVRFLLQLVRADFYNPLSQFVVRATNPLLRPLRRLIPGLLGIDMAAVALMLALEVIALMVTGALGGTWTSLPAFVVLAVKQLLAMGINVMMFSLFVQAILSWINPGHYHPFNAILYSLNEPMLRRLRQWLPPAGGLDFTPMVALVGLQVLKMLLLPPLVHLALALA